MMIREQPQLQMLAIKPWLNDEKPEWASPSRFACIPLPLGSYLPDIVGC